MKITRYRGDTKALVVVINNDTVGAPLNLAGVSVKLTVDSKSNPADSATQVFQLTGSSGSPASGEVSFDFSDSQADHVGMYYYDIEITTSDGKKETIVKGVFEFLQDITK